MIIRMFDEGGPMPIFFSTSKTFFYFLGRFKIRETSTALVIKLLPPFISICPNILWKYDNEASALASDEPKLCFISCTAFSSPLL